MKRIINGLIKIQYLQSSLYVIGLNRKKFVCNPKPNGLYALNTSKNTLISILFTLFACGLFFTGIILLINGETVTSNFVIVFFIIHPIIGILSLRQFLWLINGKQEMRIENNRLTLTKKGFFWTKPKVFDMRFVKNIRKALDQDSLTLYERIFRNFGLYRKTFFNHILGEILFDYKGKTIKVFNDLTENEKDQLIAEMKKTCVNSGYKK